MNVSIPVDVLRDGSLSQEARLLYAIIRSYDNGNGTARVSMPDLAHAIGHKSGRATRRIKKDLIRAGLISEVVGGGSHASLYSWG